MGNKRNMPPKLINHLGITFGVSGFMTIYLISSTAKSYRDALNTEVTSVDAV